MVNAPIATLPASIKLSTVADMAGLSPATRLAAKSVQTGATWLWRQPLTQWTAREFYQAGQREMRARDAASVALGKGLQQAILALHHAAAWVATTTPQQYAATKPLKQKALQLATSLKKRADALTIQSNLRKAIGAITFKGLTDTVFYAGGLKTALVALHFAPGSPLHVISPIMALYALRTGALIGPTLQKTGRQLKPVLKRTFPQQVVLA